MIYADTDFFLALMKESDWLKNPAQKALRAYKGALWTSPATLIELLLVAAEFGLDPEILIRDALALVKLDGGEANPFLAAAGYIKERKIGVFDAVHAGYCGANGTILSSDKVYDRLGLQRIALEMA